MKLKELDKKYKIIKIFPQANSHYKVGDIISYNTNCQLLLIAKDWPDYFEEVTPLITTYDNKELYKDDVCYFINNQGKIVWLTLIDMAGAKAMLYLYKQGFSSLNEATNYIDNHYPIYSKTQMLDFATDCAEQIRYDKNILKMFNNWLLKTNKK